MGVFMLEIKSVRTNLDMQSVVRLVGSSLGRRHNNRHKAMVGRTFERLFSLVWNSGMDSGTSQDGLFLAKGHVTYTTLKLLTYQKLNEKSRKKYVELPSLRSVSICSIRI